MLVSKYALSFDVDWAPDYMLKFVLSLLDKHKIKSTWFITHESEIWNYLENDKEYYNMGIHPNLEKNSSQGSTVEEVVCFLLSIVPSAQVFRMHNSFQSGSILSTVQKLSGINMDSSIFLPEIDNITAVNHLTFNGILRRIPVYWADDYEILKPNVARLSHVKLSGAGIKVFNFHPVHIYLNTPTHSYYQRKKDQIKNLTDEPYEGFGVRNIFIDLLKFLEVQKKNIAFIKDI